MDKDNKNMEDLVIKPIMGLQSEEGFLTLFDVEETRVVYHSSSEINGIGVFTPMGLEKNQFVGVGHVFYKGFWYMTAHGNYNHSENPNCDVEVDDNVLVMRANKDIKHGEELTVDYREQQFLEQPMGDWIK